MKIKIKCAACGKIIERFPSRIRRVKRPTCSRQCNGALRGQEWAKHGHKGRAGWTARSLHSYRKKMSGDRNPAWNGGSYIEPEKGYRLIRMPQHPRARANGYVLEHIIVAEKKIGRRLRKGEEVHHKNRVRADNRPANLEVISDHRTHWMKEHYATVAAARDAAVSRKRSRDSGPA